MFGAIAARALAVAKISMMMMNRRLRSMCASAAASGGPNSITVKANKVTSWPAVEIEISRSRARAGNRPMMRNSVVTMTKAAIASKVIEKKLWRVAAALGVGACVMACDPGRVRSR
ncbi:hypothetical protein D3C84_968210 [compost metagenome]